MKVTFFISDIKMNLLLRYHHDSYNCPGPYHLCCYVCIRISTGKIKINHKVE